MHSTELQYSVQQSHPHTTATRFSHFIQPSEGRSFENTSQVYKCTMSHFHYENSWSPVFLVNLNIQLLNGKIILIHKTFCTYKLEISF